MFKTTQLSDIFAENAEAVVYTGDCFGFTQTLPSDFVKLIVTSPPYNLGKNYEEATTLEEYLASFKPLLQELARILATDGSLCWQVGNFVENGEVFPLDIFYYPLFKEVGFKLRNRLIWHFEHGLHASKRFSGRYETLLWFTKSDNYTFNLDNVRVPSKYPGKKHYKGEKKGQFSGNPLGKNPSDFWKILEDDWNNGVWEVPNVKANHPEKTGHPCQFPIELVERCVLALTDVNDWVFDPFAGVGSALLAGLRHTRKVIGCEKESEYVSILKERIVQLDAGTLGYRQLGKTVYQPTRREKVAQIPIEWFK